jgi:hypothetical protein
MRVLGNILSELGGGLRLVAVCVVALAGLLSASEAGAQAQTPDSVTLVTAFELARNRGDLDLAMSYFADDATLTQRTAVYSGRDEIRRYLQTSAGRGRFVVVSNRHVDGNQLSWTERPTGQNVNGIEVSVQAIVQDGKIQSLAYNGLIPQLRPDASADGRAQLPAVFGLASVALVFAGLIVTVSLGLPHRPGSDSRLRGRLMGGLQVWRSARTANG